MRLMDAVAPKRVTIGASAPTAWAIDANALDHACVRLGLTRQVVVHVTRGRGGRSKTGLHRRSANGAHVISVVNYLSAAGASRVLWHELEHAVQLEALGASRFDADYAAESRAHGYERNRFEVAARRAERRHDVWFALTR